MSKAPKNAETDHEKAAAGESGGALGGQNAGSAEGDVTTNEVDLEGTRGVTDERLEKVNERNSEGHEKNLADIDKAHEGNTGQPAPGLGREDNGNTPRVNPDGSKTWLPPGVAGAKK